MERRNCGPTTFACLVVMLFALPAGTRLLAEEAEDRESALLFNTASRFYRLKNWRDAGRTFQEFLERFPRHEDSAEARFAAGYCLNRLGDHTAAVKLLRLAVRDENTPWQADANFYQGRSQEALATEARGNEEERARRLAAAAESYGQAAALYRKLSLGRGGSEAGAEAKKKTEAQIKDDRSRNRNLSVLAIGAQGEALYQANRYEDSGRVLEVLLEEQTSLSDSPYYQRGVYILGLARHAVARDNDPRPGAFSEARRALSVAADSRYAEEALWEKSAYLLARLAHQDGELDEAVEVYGQVIERGGDRASEASCHRGIALFETQDPKRLEQARKELSVFLEENPRHELTPKARYYAALCAFDLKDYDEAVVGFEAATDGSEFAGRALLRQGQALLLKDKPDAALAAKVLGEAVETLRKEAAAQPDGSVTRRKIAESLYWRADALVADSGASVEAASVFSEVHTSFADVSPELAEKALYQEARTLYLAGEYARGAATSAAYRERYSEKAGFHAESLLLSAKCAFHAPAGTIPESLRREGPRFYREAGAALSDPSEARWARYMSGVALYFLGDYPEAAEALDAVARESTEGAPAGEPPFPELTFYLADSLSQQPRQSVASSADRERWKRASSLYTDYLRRASRSDSPATHVPNALVNLGLCQEWLEDHEEAARTFEKFLAEFPNHDLASQVRFELGNAQLVKGDLEEAVRAYASAAESDSDSVLAVRALYQKAMLERRLERPAEAAETLSLLRLKHGEALTEQAQLSQDVHFQQGVALLEAGKAEEGRARLAEYLEQMPGTPHETEVRNQLGRSLLDDGKPREAVEILTPILEREVAAPGTDQAIYLIAWCHSALAAAEDAAASGPDSARHREEMESAYRQLIAEHPQSQLAVDAMLELGQHLFNRKAYAESKKWLGKALETLESDSVPAQPGDGERAQTILERSWFGLGFIAYEEKDFVLSAELLDRVMENPGSPLAPRAAFQAGRALSQAGKHKEAVVRFRRVADEYKDRAADEHEESLLRLGENYHQLGEYVLAIRCQDRLLTEYPEGDLRHEARFARGFALQFSDDHDSAVKAYRKVVAGTRLPVAARAQYHIGECRLEQGRHRDAAREFNTTVANFDFGGEYEEWIRRSLLAAGTAFQEVRDKEAATAQFSELVERFPESKEGRAARDRLDRLGNRDL